MCSSVANTAEKESEARGAQFVGLSREMAEERRAMREGDRAGEKKRQRRRRQLCLA